MNLNQVRIDILASRADRERLIAQMRKHAMQQLDRASQNEVLLFLQLKCDTEGTHDFVAEPRERQYDDGTFYTSHHCKICGWDHHEKHKEQI